MSRGYDRMRFWRIYGVFLPGDVLAKVYAGNAERLFRADPGVAPAGR